MLYWHLNSFLHAHLNSFLHAHIISIRHVEIERLPLPTEREGDRTPLLRARSVQVTTADRTHPQPSYGNDVVPYMYVCMCMLAM